MRTDRLVREHGVTLTHTVFPLHPETPEEGMTLAELFRGHESYVNDMRRRLELLMAEEGLEYGHRTHTYNSRRAQEIAKWADDRHPGADIHRALYRAYFVDARNLAEPGVLLDVVASLDLPVDEAREVLETRSYSPAVDRDWARARELGITGVPTFRAGDYVVVGAQPYEVLEGLIGR